MPTEWLTLSEVAELLGVHPGTVRNWADQGRLPVHRTQGGHRRFKRAELELWTQSQQPASASGDTAQVVQTALGYTRFQISEGKLESEDWYLKLDDKARDEYRRSGRKLMQGLSTFLASDKDAGQAEARAVGYDYATLGRRHGLHAVEATRAYLFFLSALEEAMLAAYEDAAIHSARAWGDMARRLHAFTNQVLLSLLETYQAFENGKK
jgi:excisionase family DNA binding protein